MKNAEKQFRFAFIDGLRGIACLLVLFHHLYESSELQKPLATLLPHPVLSLATWGARGVQIFFVLSGFVIAYSVRNLVMTRATMTNFILRRQVRLDPVYWSWLLVVFADFYVRWHAHMNSVARPGLGVLVANMFYLQGILRVDSYMTVAWTLCLEVQFYLLLILLIALSQKISIRHSSVAATFLVAVSAVLTLAIRLATPGDWADRAFIGNAWFFGNWFLFAAGALCYWALAKRAHWMIPVGVIVLIGLCGVFEGDQQLLTGAVCAGAIYGVGVLGHLGDWLGNPVIQYFGRISYSLYLTHLLVIQRIYKVGLHQTGLERWPALGWLLLATVASVAVAHVLNLAIEQPTMRLSRRLKLREPVKPSDEAPEIAPVPLSFARPPAPVLTANPL